MKKTGILTIILVLLLTSIPAYTSTSKEETLKSEMKEISTEYMIPNPLVTVDGVDYYGDEWSQELGEVDISQLNIPSHAKITSVQVYDSEGNYVKHLNDYEGTKYRIGRIGSTEKFELLSTYESAPDYFEWWRTSNPRVWAFELDGIWHFRQYDNAYEYPTAYGTYRNVRAGTGTPTSGFTATGNIPSGYTPSHPNYNRVFQEEVPNQAHIAWGSRQNISIDTGSFNNDHLGIWDIPFSKLHNVNITSIDYIQPENGISPWNIKDTVFLDDSQAMIDTKTVRLWYKALFTLEGTYTPAAGTQMHRRYYNQWRINLKTDIYKFDKYKVRVYYQIDPDAEAWLELDTNMKECPVVGDTIQIKTKITKKDGFVWEFLTTEPNPKLNYVSTSGNRASVNNLGVVTLKNPGTVEIKAIYLK